LDRDGVRGRVDHGDAVIGGILEPQQPFHEDGRRLFTIGTNTEHTGGDHARVQPYFLHHLTRHFFSLMREQGMCDFMAHDGGQLIITGLDLVE
jgi:hypothetical protein